VLAYPAMKRLLALCGLLVLPIFAADPQHLLPSAAITIHTTASASAYTAYQIVSRLQRVPVRFGDDQNIAKLQSTRCILPRVDAVPSAILDAISQIAHQQWEVVADAPGVNVIVLAPDRAEK